jgi:rhodanese-related sulfurtransferase
MASIAEPFQRITAQQAKKLIESGQVALIDVREPDEHKAGRIAGCKLIPHGKLLDLSRVNELPKNKPILFYCAAGVRSALSAEVAAAMGYTQTLYNLEGGIEAWKAAKYPVEV